VLREHNLGPGDMACATRLNPGILNCRIKDGAMIRKLKIEVMPVTPRTYCSQEPLNGITTFPLLCGKQIAISLPSLRKAASPNIRQLIQLVYIKNG